MKSAIYTGKEKMEIRDAAPVAPNDDEVRLVVAWCGICGTDLHIFHGRMDKRVAIPQVIGHEMSGTVVEVGRKVTNWQPGDRVVVRPLDWCGDCPACRAGHSHVCMNLKFMGIDSIGAFQESWTVKARTLHRVPDNLDLKTAALVEPLAVACHDVRTAELAPNEFALVQGAGPIGLLIALVARAQGIRVLLSEINPNRLALARQLGFEAVNPMETDLVALVNERTDGAGADALFEVTASMPGAASMTQTVRVRGKIVLVGIFSTPAPVDLHRFFWRELRLLGARLYTPDDFDQALALADTGNMPLDCVITNTFPLDQIQTAFASLAGNPTAVKTLIQCSQS
ncbi:MAG: alcohol dehydrogenase catalytic domain-containing protein [Planctomycetia bacterium]|nr:alcohol dehydrogenase catalytic domain-containing protein [Planctomycetia bacterium]